MNRSSPVQLPNYLTFTQVDVSENGTESTVSAYGSFCAQSNCGADVIGNGLCSIRNNSLQSALKAINYLDRELELFISIQEFQNIDRAAGLNPALFVSLQTIIMQCNKRDCPCMTQRLHHVCENNEDEANTLANKRATLSMSYPITTETFDFETSTIVVPGSANSSLPRVCNSTTLRCLCTCAICLEEYSHHSIVKVLGCSHFFHIDCIRSWFARNATCPVCRYYLNTSL